jgi:tRNA(Arg) A34 adenosine deaminase TadA
MPNSDHHHKFIDRAVQLSINGMKNGDGGPFGAIVVKENVIIAEGWNQVLSTNDPTAHAEIVAIRNACREVNSFQLTDCVIYTSCEPCPMCLGAIYWARPQAVFYTNTKDDAAAINFDDSFIYQEISMEKDSRTIPFIRINHPQALTAFQLWHAKQDKQSY